MRLLFLAPRVPWPADTGGKIRTVNILKQMTKFAQIHLACFSFEENDPGHAKELKKLGIAVTLVPAQDPGMKRVVRQCPVYISTSKIFTPTQT